MSGRTGKRIRTSSEGRESNNFTLVGSHYKIRTEKTGHYFIHGRMSEQTRYIWICLHGYGQLAKFFIQKFEFLDPQQHYVIVPEGLNRFYFEGVREKPVASWMTREDRLDEIADYVLFLEALRQKMRWDANPNVNVFYFGFSQGVSTLIRWLTNIHPRCDRLILWAGSPPDDIPMEMHRAYFKKIPIDYFIGRQDQYITAEGTEAFKNLMKHGGMEAAIHWFDGDHRVEEIVLMEALRKW